MKSQTAILWGVGAIAGGVALRRFLRRRVDRSEANAAQLAKDEQLAGNPWLLQTQAMDAYSYYTTANQNTRFVYGVGQEVNLVDTQLLNSALEKLHGDILAEVAQMQQENPLNNYQAWFGYAQTGNPYWGAINAAIAGDEAQLNG